MKKDSGPYKKIKIYCYIVGLTAFLTAFFVGIFLLHNLEKNEKTTGKYMAQVTEKRVRARLDQYIMLSNLLGNYISAGENLDENTFSEIFAKYSTSFNSASSVVERLPKRSFSILIYEP